MHTNMCKTHSKFQQKALGTLQQEIENGIRAFQETGEEHLGEELAAVMEQRPLSCPAIEDGQVGEPPEDPDDIFASIIKDRGCCLFFTWVSKNKF